MVKNECSPCRKAKNRIASLLRSNPSYQNVITDDESSKAKFPNQKISEWLPEKDYYPDVYAEKYTIQSFGPAMMWPVIIEVDHHHRSAMSTHKDNRRDRHFLGKGIPTIRFTLDKIVGKRSYSDRDILQLTEWEIDYQLAKKDSRSGTLASSR